MRERRQAHIQRALEFYKKHADNPFEDHLRAYFSKMDDYYRECSHCQEIVQAKRQARFNRLQKGKGVYRNYYKDKNTTVTDNGKICRLIPTLLTDKYY